MQVRPAIIDDRAALVTLWERSVRATHDFLTDADIVALRPQVAEALGSDALEWWVLTVNGDEPAGFLAFANDTIEGLFIDPDVRGQGGGTFLVAHAQRLASGGLSVDVNEANTAAVGFYQSLGFTIVGRSPTDGDGRPFPLLHMRRPPPAHAVASSDLAG